MLRSLMQRPDLADRLDILIMIISVFLLVLALALFVKYR